MSKKAKKAVRIWLSVLLSVILSVQFTVVGFAAVDESEVEPRMTHTQDLPIAGTIKEEDWWCWAACGSAATSYLKGYFISQTTFYQKAMPHKPIIDQPGTMDDIQTGLDYYSIHSTKVGLNEDGDSPLEISQVLTISKIISDIDSGSPIFTRFTTIDAYSSHCRLIRGYTFHDTTGALTVKYFEPDTGMTVQRSYDTFCYYSEFDCWLDALCDVSIGG